MGLFGKKSCCICGNNNGKYKSIDGLVCQECFRSCGRFIPVNGFTFLKTFKKQEIENFIARNKNNEERKKIFKPTLTIDEYAEFDDINRLWSVNESKPNGLKVSRIIRSYDELENFEIRTSGKTVIEGGEKSARLGGVLYGETGAIVGGIVGRREVNEKLDYLKIEINVKDSQNPILYVTLIQSETTYYAKEFNIAQKIADKLSEILNSRNIKRDFNVFTTASAPDEIMKYKKLLDTGAISQEEYHAKKKQLLDM